MLRRLLSQSPQFGYWSKQRLIAKRSKVSKTPRRNGLERYPYMSGSISAMNRSTYFL